MTLRAIGMWLRAFFDRAGTERDLDDELRFHLEQQTAALVRAGLSPDEARRRARLALGGVERTKESHRDGRGTRTLEDVAGDIRYAIRALWRDRALAVAGVLTLALGIGATTAVFSAVNAVMLRQLPFADPGRLVAVWEENPDRNWYKNVVAPANFLDWREQADGFAGIAAYTDYIYAITLTGRGEPRLLSGSAITANFLDVLGVRPLLGHGFTSAEDYEEGQRVVLISNALWRKEFRSDPDVVGSSVSLGGQTWQIAGVMPDGFSLPSPVTDLWIPMLWGRRFAASVSFRRAHWLRAVGRLKPGVSEASANASLQTVVKRLEAQYPATNTRMGAGITPLHEWIVGDTRRPLLVLLGAAAVLLLIACANVGNLLLVHALGRSRDVALRFALGATRVRVARQALTESLVLSAAGGVAGCALGWVGARALLAMQPTGMLPVEHIGLDYRVLAFAVALTTLSGLVFGIAPAVAATRQAPAEALNAGGRTLAGGARRVRRWGRALVAAEVGLAVLLTVGAGLLLRSYERLTRVPPGFDPTGVLTVSLSLPGARYDSSAKVVRFYHTLLERTQALPGVERAAATRELPVTQSSWTANLAVQGRPPMEQSADIIYREVLGDYARTMRVPLLAGRAFTDADRADAPAVAVINDVLARQYFPNEDPVGHRIATARVPDSTTTWYTVVGVVGSEHQGSLALPARPVVLLPMPQSDTRRMSVVMRTREGIDPASLAGPVRGVIRGMDSLLAITSIRPMTDVYRDAMSRQRFTSVLVLVFALSGVVLALVGVFGVLAQLVQSREREMGIRLALGAQRSQVRWLVVRQGALLLSGGIAAGLGAAVLTTRVMESLLFQVAATDAATYAAVALLILGIGLLAAWLPARRASTADPALALRAE